DHACGMSIKLTTVPSEIGLGPGKLRSAQIDLWSKRERRPECDCSEGAQRSTLSPVSGSLTVPAMVIEMPPREWSGVIGVGRTHDAAIAVAVIGRSVTCGVVGRGVTTPGIRIIVAVAAVIGRCVAVVVTGIAIITIA